ncbi:hypothetical protein [Myroides sp. DW712]|uniref:hypothetical protein n=1 Tax=Myroides sp. DW712 TaxID=3389800 RepID=UPI00397A41B3
MTTNWQGVSQQDFSQDLLQKLGTCMTDNNIYTLWLGIIWESSTLRGLWMHVKDKSKTESVFSSIYKKTVVNEERILLVILDNADIAQQIKMGNILFKTSLIASHIIYQTNATHQVKPIYKPLGPYIALYQDKQAFLTSYCNDFVAQKYRGSSLAFLKSFTYNLDVLETVLLGITNTTETLTHRLLILEQIVPKMKTLFVKREAEVYYMLDDLAQDIEDVDYTIWNEALLRVQKKLYHLVLGILEQINGQTAFVQPKRQIRKKKGNRFTYSEQLLPLLKTNQVEEIYQFHEILYLQQNQQQKQVFLLVLTKENPSKTLKKIIATIEEKQDDVRFTLLAHTRLYIQDYVYEFSAFFKKILQPKNRIFASDYYPQIHWYKSYMQDYSDFVQPYRDHLDQVNQTIRQDFKTHSAQTFITTQQLHLCLTTKLHLYLLHHLHYLPHTKNLNTLVNLTLYAKNKEASSFKARFDQLHPLVFAYTVQHKRKKKYNLVLDPTIVQHLQSFFSTIEV